MTEVYCKAKGAMCDPKDCSREFCWWRDTVWAIKNMGSWAYDTSYEKPGSDKKKTDVQENDIKDSE
jgi:hypothetical protein